MIFCRAWEPFHLSWIYVSTITGGEFMRSAILSVFTAAVMALGVAGCTTTQQGAVIGGATGAAVGGAATGQVGGAVAGGAIGAFAGALIGEAAGSNRCIYENRWGYRYTAPCP
jgi:Glycine zipper